MKTAHFAPSYTSTLASVALAFIVNQVNAQEVLWQHDLKQDPFFSFVYGSWSGQLATSDEGVVISKEADHTGGAGFTVSPPLNIQDIPIEKLFAVVRAKLLPESTAQKVGFLLCSNPGSDSSVWQFPLSSLSTEEFTDVEIALSDNPAHIRDAGVNLSNIMEVQVQGDYTNPGIIGIILQSIKIISK